MSGVVFSVILVVHVLAGLGVIGLVLMQHGKGADMGAAFGSGASGSLFGSSGSANFLSRTTGILAAVFFVTSLSLSYLAGQKVPAAKSVMDGVAPATAPAAPVAGESQDSKSKDIPR
ncbi:MAG: preprotein translocase subunit SecG [Proteobacteria bacterium]|nr:preprotein translocase subunit SecG [Pseudomonadota bacterium]